MISIIVPFASTRTLPQLLDAVAPLQCSTPQWEMILVDNTRQGCSAELPPQLPIRMVREEIPGSYRARNRGAHEARGTIFAFTDSDCLPAADWLNVIDNAFQDTTLHAVMGMSYGKNKNRVACLEQRMYEQNIAAFTTSPLQRLDTRNCAVRRSVFEALHGFQSDLLYGGDWEFGARLHAADFRARFLPNMVVFHENPTDLRALLQKRITQNNGNMRILHKHPQTFCQQYFPSLLTMHDHPWWMRLLVKIAMPASIMVSPVLVRILPFSAAYFIFKVANVLAMRKGQCIHEHRI